MSTLLYIQASPRGERSSSSDVANSYIDAFRAVSGQAHRHIAPVKTVSDTTGCAIRIQ